jgi:hypothetical protein
MQQYENMIGKFNNDNEKRIWIASFERACRDDYDDLEGAVRAGDIAVMAYRQRL